MTEPITERRIEEASLNAWPALHQMLYDGWLLRFAGGFTKRSNSVVPLYPAREGALDKVRYCENLYAREQLRTIFRLTSIADQGPLDELLAARGYGHADATLVMTAPIGPPAPATPGFELIAPEAWLDVYTRFTRMPAQGRALHGMILKAIRSECAFAVVRERERIFACGLGVAEGGLVGLFDVVTSPEYRRAGHATALVQGLLAWARGQGADTAYLQVVADNEPAQALYARLGFSACYRYWYRISP
jgi:GNAT superfamily N-acetyltransferase